jgi:hypothetical protein
MQQALLDSFPADADPGRPSSEGIGATVVSDQTTFARHLGIPIVDMTFKGLLAA